VKTAIALALWGLAVAFNTGLTSTFVGALAIDPMESRRVYAGTCGDGVP
jgi:hypothetical protein